MIISKEKQQEIDSLSTISIDIRAKDLTGKRQGSITFLKPAEKINKRIYWWVICDCGNIEKVRADSKIQRCKECNAKRTGEQNRGKNLIDLTNQRFGRLTVLFLQNERRNGNVMWHCKCDCGNECDVQSTSLTSGNTKSCGCQKRERAYFTTLKKDLSGKKFGYLTVLKETKERQYGGKVIWECQCDCGNIVYLNTGRLTSGNDTSCGCKKQSIGVENIKNILNQNNIVYKKEYKFNDYQERRYDFAIFNNEGLVIRLIEFDGEQHYKYTGGWNDQKSLEKNKLHDKEKNEYALSHNIPLVRIPYWKRDNITLDMIMGDKYLVK